MITIEDAIDDLFNNQLPADGAIDRHYSLISDTHKPVNDRSSIVIAIFTSKAMTPRADSYRHGK